LLPGLEVRFERSHDLSAVIHVEKLRDGRIMITAVPLLYGSYTTAKGTGTFSLDPPLTLNLQAGWPLFKEQSRLKAELRYADFRRSSTGTGGQIPIAGVTAPATPPSAANSLVRVEQARPVEPAPTAPKLPMVAAASPAGKKGKAAKGKPTPATTAAPTQAPVVVQNPAPSATPIEIASAAAVPNRSPVAAASPAAATAPAPGGSPAAAATPVTIGTDTALASTAGGGSWKTFAPGKMPLGRLITAGDLNDIAERGLAGERIYLKGQFVVNFSDANKAVLRPRTRLASAMLHLGNSPTRIIVEFPEGYTPPAQGSVVSRDEARPLELTEVRRQEDGQLNVFAREIMQ
jgi:hypothetical protein